MKIGIYGGSFNPVHVGHLTVAEQVKKSLNLDKVIFVPAGNPYFKDQHTIESFSARECMLRDSIRGMDGMEVSVVESDPRKPSYTSETLKWFHEQYPKAEMFLIVGSDAFYQLHQWHDVETIFELATIVHVDRDGILADVLDDGSLNAFVDWTKTPQYKKMKWIRIPCQISISSSYIRKQIQEDKSFRFLVTHPVYKRIVNARMYGYGGNEHVVF